MLNIAKFIPALERRLPHIFVTVEEATHQGKTGCLKKHKQKLWFSLPKQNHILNIKAHSDAPSRNTVPT